MNLQFADLNADGNDDIITATFEGTSMVVYGGKDGWSKPEHVKDSQDRNLVLSLYYDFEENKYDNADRSPEGKTHAGDHCVSTTAMDIDDDGDLDLLLGAKEGRLYLRKNIGSSKEPVFEGSNHLLEAGGSEFMIPGGLTAACPFDWDLDGDLDLVCGSFGGGVYFVENKGIKDGLVALSKPRKIHGKEIDLGGKELSSSVNWYVTPVDYDEDGKLDLLVGMHVNKPKVKKKLSDDDKQLLKQLRSDNKETLNSIRKIRNEIERDVEDLDLDDPQKEVLKRFKNHDELKELNKKMMETYDKIWELQPPNRPEPGVYLIRAK